MRLPPAPPASGQWYDEELTFGQVLAVLRLGPGDVDGTRIREQIPAAAQLIDQFLDRIELLPGPPPPDPVQQALVSATCELYRRKDQPTLAGGFSVAAASMQSRYADGDPLGDLYQTLEPWRTRWGIG